MAVPQSLLVTLRLLMVPFAVGVVVSAPAEMRGDENAPAQADAAILQSLSARAVAAEAVRAAAEPAVLAARKQAQELNDRATQLKIEFSKAEATYAQLVTKSTAAGDALRKAEEERKVALEALSAARKAALEAAGKENAAPTQEAFLKAAEALAGKVTAVQTAGDALQAATKEATQTLTVLAGHPGQIAVAEKGVADFAPKLAEAETAYGQVAKAALADQVAFEKAEIRAGLRVSFADHVAPIFAQRCVACHNARTSKGRLNMESFAALMKGGESGPSVLAFKPSESQLHMEIEYGSMPKDADPLAPEQIAVVTKWIQTGARLDAGVSSTAPLISIMPKPVQPSPPESYRVAVPITALAFSPDGSLLATSGYREVVLWNAADGQLVRRISNLAERPHDVEFNTAGDQIAVAAGTPGQLGEVKIFKVADGSLVRDVLTTDDEVFSVAWSPDGTKLAASCADRSIRVHAATTGQRLLQIEDHADWVLSVAWSPDGQQLVTASRDKTSKVFNANTGEAVVTFNGHGEPVFSAIFVGDGKQVLSAARDKKLRLWTVADGKQVREIAGFGGDVFQVQLTADGQTLASSSDKTVRWHKLDNGQQVRALAGHNDWVYAVAIHAATKRIATGSHDGEVRLWNLDDGQLVKAFVAAPGLTPAVTAAK